MASEKSDNLNGDQFDKKPSSSSDDSDELIPVEKIRSTHERQFEEVRTGDRAQLQKIASELVASTSSSGSQLDERTIDNALTRKDTLHNVKLGDPVRKSDIFCAKLHYSCVKKIISLSKRPN